MSHVKPVLSGAAGGVEGPPSRKEDRLFATCLTPSPERRSAEVHQQPQRQVHQPQIGQDLLAVDRRDPLHRLQLDQKLQ